jgi:hypothetical protein
VRKKNLVVKSVKNQNKVAVILLQKPTFIVWVVITNIVVVEVLVVVLGVTRAATQHVPL